MDDAVNQARAYVSAMRAAGCADPVISAELQRVGWADEQMRALLGATKSGRRRTITVRQIIKAIHAGDLSSIRRRLSGGADPNSRSTDEPHDTPLHQAALLDSYEAARLLLEHGANVAATDDHGDTPLHVAALRVAHDVAGLLLHHGADPNTVSGGYVTPLLMTTYSGHDAPSVAQLLIQYGATVDYVHPTGLTPLGSAAANGHIDIVRALLQGGATYSLPAACLLDDARAVQWFLSTGADPTTGILIAAARGSTLLVGMLLDAGADVNARDYENWTPLAKAMYGEHLNTVGLLLQRGADPNDGRSLQRAVKRNLAPAIELLRAYGAME